MVSRQKAGKSFLNVAAGATLNRPSALLGKARMVGGQLESDELQMATHIACASTGGRVLTFELRELKHMATGGPRLLYTTDAA